MQARAGERLLPGLSLELCEWTGDEDQARTDVWEVEGQSSRVTLRWNLWAALRPREQCMPLLGISGT